MKSGFVAIIGIPNVGKSTLLNQILSQKVSIVSPKQQTTRNVIRGIYHSQEAQVVFIDTPGVHKAQHKLGETLNFNAFTTMKQVDLVYLIVDASKKRNEIDTKILENLKKTKSQVFLLLNKVDLIPKDELLVKILQYSNLHNFDEIIPISALKNDNIDDLIKTTISYLSEGPEYYPKDMTTDYSEKFIFSEIIREKILFATYEEIPHSIAVIIEKMTETDELIKLNALIVVERDSQKGIIIGKAGQTLKKVGMASRKELEYLLGKKVHLETFVRVEKDWRNKSKQLNDLGYQKGEV